MATMDNLKDTDNHTFTEVIISIIFELNVSLT